MKAVIQRVKYAKVTINEKTKDQISQGLLVLIGILADDKNEDINYLIKKIINLRIFDDTKGVMNLSVKDIAGELMVVSQFTLQASTKKGNRPSYIKAAKPDIAIPVYNYFISELEKQFGKPIKTGEFGADMQIELLNDGPITLIIDTKNK